MAILLQFYYYPTVATEYGSMLHTLTILLWWWLGDTNLGDRDGAENKSRAGLLLAKGLCVRNRVSWPLPQCRVMSNAFSPLFSFGQR